MDNLIPDKISSVRLIQEEQAIEINDALRLVFRKGKDFEMMWLIAKKLASEDSSGLPGVSEQEIRRTIKGVPSALNEYWWQKIWVMSRKAHKVYGIFEIANGDNTEITDNFIEEAKKNLLRDSNKMDFLRKNQVFVIARSPDLSGRRGNLFETNDRDCFASLAMTFIMLDALRKFLREELFQRPQVPPESKLQPSMKLFSLAPGVKKEFVPASKPYKWEMALQKKTTNKSKRMRSKNVSTSVPSPQIFEEIMRSLRKLQHEDLETQSDTIFDSIYDRCSILKEPKDPIEITKIILRYGSGHTHPELFEGWDSPMPGVTLLEWVENYEHDRLQLVNDSDFLNSRLGDFVFDRVSQELDKYDDLFDAIRRKEPRNEISSKWDDHRPKGFFKDAFLNNIGLFLDNSMVQDYRTAFSKLKVVVEKRKRKP